jgi:outer membrane protein G
VNLHQGSTIGLGDNFDAYPGLNVSFKIFGLHAGARYFFSDSMRVFAELGHSIARYKSKGRSPSEDLNKQLVINLGLSLNFL